MAQKLSAELSFPRAMSPMSKSPNDYATMELTAVTCIAKAHHFAFLRLPCLGLDNLHRWAFYDSMSNMENGHMVPSLVEVPGLARYFQSGCSDTSCLFTNEGASGREFVARCLLANSFMSLYTRKREVQEVKKKGDDNTAIDAADLLGEWYVVSPSIIVFL